MMQKIKTSLLFSTIAISGFLFTSCAKRYEPGLLNVTVVNQANLMVSDIEIESAGLLYSSPSLLEDESYQAALNIGDNDEIIFRYSDPVEGEIVRTIRIPARPSDGGELSIEIFEDGYIKPSSRFDLYYK